jgi:DNA-binding transcriptional MerR regulator
VNEVVSELSVKDVARIVGLDEARLRYWAQTGLMGPSVRRGARSYYTFTDLIGVKVVKELLERGLSLQAVRKSLEALRQSLPAVDRPLAQLRVTVEGERLVVADADAPYEADSGQLIMSFAVEPLARAAAEITPAVAPPPPAPVKKPEPTTAYAAFRAALALHDAADHGRAEAGYRRALAIDASLASAWTNLAVLLERRGERAEALSAAERAVLLDPEQPEARYNLACLLADAGERGLAVAQYHRVLDRAPDFADARHNLAILTSDA